MMNFKKTIFGNYFSKEVDAYLQSVEEQLGLLRTKDEEIQRLTKIVEDYEHKATEIGEAVIYAKQIVFEARLNAEKESKAIMDNAISSFVATKESMIEEIDELTKKREEAINMYKAMSEQLINNLSHIDQKVNDEQYALNNMMNQPFNVEQHTPSSHNLTDFSAKVEQVSQTEGGEQPFFDVDSFAKKIG